MQLKRLARSPRLSLRRAFHVMSPSFPSVRRRRRKARRVMSSIPRDRQTASAARPRPWASAGCEPRLDDVLADPLVHQLMRRDGVEPAYLRTLVAVVRAK